jgi:hypothetical protein
VQKSFAKILSCASILILGLAHSQVARATTYTVGAGQNFTNPSSINWSQIVPGDTLIIYPGTYGDDGKGNSLTISGVSGTAAAPIKIQAYSTANRPVLTYGIELTNYSKYVYISGMDVSRPASLQAWAAVVVHGQSADTKLTDLKVHNSHVGVSFTQAGARNKIETSEVYSNVHHGITAAPVAGDTGNRSNISGNYVHDNGGHGIDITGSYWRVERNAVAKNGSGYGGTSGIHVFSAQNPATSTCAYNEIFYNYTYGQYDSSQADGNGIQIDHFCDYNTVAFNVAWSNAGAGISLFVGKGDKIYSNTLRGNATDLNRLSQPGVWRGEMILGSLENVCANSDTAGTCLSWITAQAGRSSDNAIYDNVIVSIQNSVPAINATPDFINPSRNTNNLYPNMYFNTGSGSDLRWGSQDYYTAAQIDTATNLAGGGNIVESPYFFDITNPKYGNDGLKLTKKPSKEGWVISPQVADMKFALPVTGSSYFGAYYTNPN